MGCRLDRLVACCLACVAAEVSRAAVAGVEQSSSDLVEVASTGVAASEWSEGQAIDLDADADGCTKVPVLARVVTANRCVFQITAVSKR